MNDSGVSDVYIDKRRGPAGSDGRRRHIAQSACGALHSELGVEGWSAGRTQGGPRNRFLRLDVLFGITPTAPHIAVAAPVESRRAAPSDAYPA